MVQGVRTVWTSGSGLYRPEDPMITQYKKSARDIQKEQYIKTDRKTVRNREKDSKKERETERQSDRDRKTERETDKETKL